MLKPLLVRVNWLLTSRFGIDFLKRVCSFHALPRFVSDANTFAKIYYAQVILMLCVHDWHEEDGTAKDKNFWQNLLAAR